MSTNPNKRVYGKLRDIIERHGGTMTYHGRGLHGAWEISLGGKRVTFEATGAKAFPKLDSLYVPLVENPKDWDDDYSWDLVADAEQRLLALLV